MARIQLADENGQNVHTEGEIADSIIMEVSFLIHNERYYRYYSMKDGGKLRYAECGQPYRVTEF